MSESQYLTISEVEGQENAVPIWVLNTARAAIANRKPSLVIAVPKLGGQGSDQVIIPATTIPVSLTNQVQRRALMDSSELRKAFSLGMIKFITDAQAQKMLNDPANRREVMRLQEESQAQEMEANQAILGTGNENIRTGAMDLNKNKVNPAIVAILDEAQHNTDMDEETAAARVRNLGPKSEEDLKYMVGRLETLGYAAWGVKAARALAKLEEARASAEVDQDA